MRQILVLPVSVVAVSLVSATEYAVDSSLKTSAEYNDNYRLTVDDEISLSGYTVTPSISAQANEENWNASLNADFDFSRFNLDELDTDDQDINFNFANQGEIYYVNVFAGLVRDTTRTSEVEDSGRVGGADRHEQYSLGSSAAYIFSEKNRLNFSASAAESKYDAVSRTDYQYFQGQLGWAHSLSEQLTLSLTANASRIEYEPTEISAEFQAFVFNSPADIQVVTEEFAQSRESTTDSEGWSAVVDYQFTEKFNLSASYGNRDTDTKIYYDIEDFDNSCNRADTDSFYVSSSLNFCNSEDSSSKVKVKDWDVNAEWVGERHKFNVGYTNNLQPSSDGLVIESERVSFFWRYSVTKLGSLVLDTTWGENSALDDPLANNGVSRVDRTFTNAVINYYHRIAENWFVNASLRYSNQDRELNNGIAESTAITLGIKYQPTKSSWSR